MNKIHQLPGTTKKFGIIGGGQLALMLADAATRLGIDPVIFAQGAKDPAARYHSRVVLKRADTDQSVKEFLSQVTVVIFENEFINCDELEEVSKSCSPRLQFYPSLCVLRVFQDKLRQKELLIDLEIPTPRYFTLPSFASSSGHWHKDAAPQISEKLRDFLDRLGGRCVLKWSRMGYDGKGVFFLRSASEIDLSAAAQFCLKGEALGAQIYAEELVPYERELAIVGVLSTCGEFVSYPLMVSEQKNGICYQVVGPATFLENSQRTRDLEVLAKAYAEKTARKTGLIGTFAIEFFETKDGILLVNEIAPRVHNSGHYTQNAGMADQFENHLRAVLGYPLGRTNCVGGFAMLNLLGPSAEDYSLAGDQVDLPIPPRSAHLHWYGKESIRPFRKLGHLNGRVDELSHLPELLSEMQRCSADWSEKIVKTIKSDSIFLNKENS